MPFLPIIIQHRETGFYPCKLRTAKSGRELFKWIRIYSPDYVARFATVADAKAFIAAARINPAKVTILQQREGARYA